MSLKEDTNGLPQTFFVFKLEWYTFNIHADYQVYMLSNFRKRASEVIGRQTNLIAGKLTSETVKQIMFGEMIDDPLQGIQTFWGQGQFSKNMWLRILSDYLCKVTWASVFLRQNFLKNVLSTCMYSICRVEIFYQFLQCTVPDKFEHDPNFLPFILFYTLKLKHKLQWCVQGRVVVTYK